jgi:alpha-L-fucosidase
MEDSNMTLNKKYLPTWESIRTHELPKWYDDAKFGIFIHWGLYSVPAYAPPTGELGSVDWSKWFYMNPYAEWYLNSIRLKSGDTWEYHKKKYGENFDYELFSYMWKAEKWDPNEWAQIFKEVGARYVVLTTKHHDGFCLWPSRYTEYNSYLRGPKRDIVGELTNAVRSQGIKMGLYYSGALDWRFTEEPITSLGDLLYIRPQTYAYADYAYNQVMELIDRYKPSILWGDIGWPEKGREDLKYIFAHYYNTVPEGVVNDRWDGVWKDFSTKEYQFSVSPIQGKWEMTRGIGFSFGYNANEGPEHIISEKDLVELLVKTVANGGNLLLNIGPRADGTIPELQLQRLRQLGDWLRINGEAIYGTKPWIKTESKTLEGNSVCFTSKDNNLYVIVLGPAERKTVTLDEFIIGKDTRIQMLGVTQTLDFEYDAEAGRLTINLPEDYQKMVACAIKITSDEFNNR